jgi:hypothetical protein
MYVPQVPAGQAQLDALQLPEKARVEEYTSLSESHTSLFESYPRTEVGIASAEHAEHHVIHAMQMADPEPQAPVAWKRLHGQISSPPL